MSDSRILILEGYDASPLGSHSRESSRQREWNACKVGRKVEVYLRGTSAPSIACTNNTKFWVAASSKVTAKKLAVVKFREDRASRKRSRSYGAPSAGQSAAQRRFAAAAHACSDSREGKNRSYLSCMRQKLTK